MDMAKILADAYQLADEITESDEAKRYLQLQIELGQDAEAKKLIYEFQKVKELYEEAQRFGIFHPNYHEAKEKVEVFQGKLRDHPVVGAFIEAEDRLDQLLYQVSVTLAGAVSETIKTPGNGIRPERPVKGKC